MPRNVRPTCDQQMEGSSASDWRPHHRNVAANRPKCLPVQPPISSIYPDRKPRTQSNCPGSEVTDGAQSADKCHVTLSDVNARASHGSDENVRKTMKKYSVDSKWL